MVEQTQVIQQLQESEEFVIFSYHHPEIFEESKIFIGYGKAQKADFDTGPFPCFTVNDWRGEGNACWHFEHWEEFDLDEVNELGEKEKGSSLCLIPNDLSLNSNLWNYASETPESYAQKVEQIQEAMRAGEVYVMNLCLELAGKGNVSRDLLLSAYSKFLAKNPIHCGGIVFTKEQKFCSLSPEVFLHQKGTRFSTYPIKGTGSREFLETSEKEASELEMVTDLLRNDLGQIAEKVWIERERFFTELPHFAHAQAEICAEISDFSWNRFRSILPCGSMTGAPKSRVLQLTEQFETFERMLYAGNFGVRKNAEEGIWNILIRTLFLTTEQQINRTTERRSDRVTEQSKPSVNQSISRSIDRWSFPVGAGITVESDPQREAEECIAKAKILQELFGR